MCGECEGRWALVRTLGGPTLKNPAEKQEPGKEGKHWGGERRERTDLRNSDSLKGDTAR